MIKWLETGTEYVLKALNVSFKYNKTFLYHCFFSLYTPPQSLHFHKADGISYVCTLLYLRNMPILLEVV